MNKSESIKELAVALSKMQSEIRGYKEDSNNPFFKSKYGDLTSVWAAIRESLTKNNLSVVQTMGMSDKEGYVIVETMLLHSSGEYITGRLELKPDKPGPQAIGSAVTYGRRYSLAAITGIAPEDDDAEGATDRKQNKKKTTAKPKETKPKDPLKKIWNTTKAGGITQQEFTDICGIHGVTSDTKNSITKDQITDIGFAVEKQVEANKEGNKEDVSY